MYRIICSHVLDDGANPVESLEDATAELAWKVSEAVSAGWKCAGGLTAISRPHRSGVYVFLMQAMEQNEPENHTHGNLDPEQISVTQTGTIGPAAA